MEVTADDEVDTNTLKIKRLNLKMDFDHNYTLPNVPKPSETVL